MADGTYAFLVDTYATELEKTLSVWAQFDPARLHTRPHPHDRRGRSLLEHMVHQCTSEHAWFTGMLGIPAGAPPLPAAETKAAFLATYAAAATHRLQALRAQDDAWWPAMVSFFGTPRSRAWVLVRRIAHTAHHRGQQTAMLRQLGQPLYSTYGPTADTGGLAKDGATVVYPYPDVPALLAHAGDAAGRQPLPPPVDHAVSERPDA